MSFRWPELLWALLLVPLVLLVWMRGERRRGQRAMVFGNPALLPNMVTARPGWRRVLPVILYLLAATVLLVALARPEATAQVPRDQATIMLVMDTSRSMLATDLSPSRREAAQQAADAFLKEIPERFQVGLVTFAAAPSVEALPTTDKEVIRTALRNAPTRYGTAIGDALVRALQASRPRNAVNNDRPPTAILLLTDGESRSGIPPVVAAQQAAQEKVPVFTVALATQPPPELQQVAEISGGQAFVAPTTEQLTAVYRDLGTRLTYVEEKRELTSYFMGGAAVLLLLGAAASITWFLRLP
jgi:Ca-activated chloride channel family protein